MLIFAEGATTNNSSLLRFKKGAFMGEKCVKPIILKYSVGSCSAAWGANDFLPLVFINLSWICGMSVEVHVLSDFEPNEYLFT